MPDEDEHPVRPLSGGWNRGIASSEASSSASGPRRSARLTSGSASSSVEPLDEVEKPRRRLRRRGPIVRTSSEEDVASQGGISRLSGNSKYAKIFEEAGFESISWRRDKGRIAKEFAPIAQLAENIPHELYDQLNSLPPSARRAGNMQVLVFEAEIRANTAEDEPNAPPIRIINDVDDEPTPPLEFFYSNLMWHGKGVPKPDYDALQGCSCSGPCEPSSCACARKHKDYCKGTPSFMYDKKGKVRAIDDELPIFECNMNCGCSDDCPNRVVQHGRQHEIMIKKTPNKGWGIFAGSKKIPAHTYIGVYAGEYLMDADGEARGKIYNKFGRTYLFDVDFWHVKKKTGHEDVRYCIDAYHAGNNHSCDPNCAIVAVYINEANVEKPLLAIFTKREIDPGQELCFSYMGNVDDSDIESDSDDSDDDTFGGGVYVKCQCGAANCCGKMWK
ncbi:SET domain-containing protein [Lentinus tigrinus ALCF2SS1-7]|uniref:SET domain-containing protein n=1 Tax=Lentinus tigrinus ALCF2SS1-7 TaxID=1328758 RepID=UPI0011660C0C|nr:SET domain-containing protein [Lentinus tigrinus ALCF2SS1-7]